jgi:hypothetical protein
VIANGLTRMTASICAVDGNADACALSLDELLITVNQFKK